MIQLTRRHLLLRKYAPSAEVTTGNGLSAERSLFLDEPEVPDSGRQGLRRSKHLRDGGPAARPGERGQKKSTRV